MTSGLEKVRSESQILRCRNLDCENSINQSFRIQETQNGKVSAFAYGMSFMF